MLLGLLKLRVVPSMYSMDTLVISMQLMGFVAQMG